MTSAAEKDTRLYIKLHNEMPEHPKVEPLSDAAFRLLVTIWCWCDRHNTDGLVPKASWAKRGTPKARRELVDARLAELTETGVQMHDYLGHQRSAAEKLELKEKRAKAGAKGGRARASAEANAKQVLQQTDSKPVAEKAIKGEKEQLPVELNPRGHRHETLPASPATEPARCVAHRGLPEDQVPPCRGCMVAAEKAGQQHAVTTAQQALTARMAIDNCGACNDQGFIEDTDTHDLIGRCNHARAAVAQSETRTAS